MRGRIVTAHILFLIVNIFVVVDFWQTRQTTDQVTDVQPKVVYNPGRATDQPHTFGLCEISTNHHSFTIPEKYVSAFGEDSMITVYYTRFLRIVRHIEIDNQYIPISLGLYAAISFAVIAIAIAALCLARNTDFQVFAAIINVLLSLMVFYIIWF